MEQARWSAYLKDPSRLTDAGGDSVGELERLRQRFPHCRVLYLLECRAMKEEDRLEWKQRAREWAILVPDRKRLFELLQEERGEEPKKRDEDSGSRSSERTEEEAPMVQRHGPESGPEFPEIDPSPLEEQIRSEAVRDRILYDAEDALLESTEEEEASEGADEEGSGQGSAENEDPEEKSGSEEAGDEDREAPKGERSFTDWLDPGSASQSGSEEDRSEEELIEAFISEGEELPKPEPKKQFFSSERMARNSSDESGLPVSETLAEIYVQQGDYKRAIQAFEQLRLNIPEKSDYFARRVQQIKERTKR